MAISIRHSSLGRPNLIIIENQFLIHCMEKGTANSSKSLIAIQRSDRKLWLFRNVTQALDDQTSSSPRISSSSTAWKRAPKTPVKVGSRSNGRITSYGPFDPSIKPGSTRPQHDLESIPHPLHGKGHPKTRVKVLSRSNGRIESYGPFNPSIQPGSTRDHHHRVSIPHPLHGAGHPETPVKVLSRSNGRIESYSPFKPFIQPRSTGPHHHRLSIPHPLHGKGHPETLVKV